jgi:hypothetical protein
MDRETRNDADESPPIPATDRNNACNIDVVKKANLKFD